VKPINTRTTIKIDYDLWVDLVLYAFRYANPGDPQYDSLWKAVLRKDAALQRHDLYTASLTATTPEERIEAYRKYRNSRTIWDHD